VQQWEIIHRDWPGSSQSVLQQAAGKISKMMSCSDVYAATNRPSHACLSSELQSFRSSRWAVVNPGTLGTANLLLDSTIRVHPPLPVASIRRCRRMPYQIGFQSDGIIAVKSSEATAAIPACCSCSGLITNALRDCDHPYVLISA
jgi:hypothetical protein